MISEMYRDYQARYDVDAAELRAGLNQSLQDKLASLAEDAWVFRDVAEVNEEVDD